VGGFTTLTLKAQYPGNLYDNILLVTSAPVTIGNFRVAAISGNNLTIETLYLNTAGAVAPGDLVCTLTLPVLNGSTDASQLVTIGDGSWTIPTKIGSKVLLNLTSLYFGSIGDSITLENATGTIQYGTFTVISFNASFQLTLQYTGPTNNAYAGQAIFGAMLAVVTGSRTFSQSFTLNGANGHGGPFIVEAAGGLCTVYQAPFGPTFLCKLYDNVEVSLAASGTSLGLFRVVADGNYFDGDHSYPFITLQSLVPNPTYQGQSFNQKITITLAGPSYASTYPGAYVGYLVVNAGKWSIPAVGNSVNLQMLWPDALGPSYPGNVGDIVQLLNGANTLAYFQVTGFDLNGNIQLTTWSNTKYATPAASIGQKFTGEQSLTMTIVQVLSTIGENISQLPAAGPMVYYQGIVWYAQGDIVSGGDIVGGPSGTPANQYTDSVLCVTENPLALGGDGFRLPIPGNVTGMAWPAQDNAALGQGLLYIGTVNGVCSLQVPANRQSWISMTSAAPPQINVVLGGKRETPGYGPVNDWCIVPINGDLYFQTIAPGIQSIILAQRYFQQWGNIDISDNEYRLWAFTNTQLLSWVSGFYFNKRLLMTALPEQTIYGVIHKAVLPMDMTPIDTFEELSPPNWEGMHEDLQIFQLLTSGEFSGQQRAFAVTLSETNPGEIDLWENIPSPTQYDDVALSPAGQPTPMPIQWQFETPAFTWERESELKELLGGSLWVDGIVGEVVFKVEWRSDFAACWQLWAEWTECFAANSLSNPNVKNPSPYPVQYPPGYKPSIDLPRPPQVMQPETGRPAAQGFQFQLRVTITGQARVRGLALHCQMMEKNIYQFMIRGMKKLINSILK
jgi:hypothetical protein